jgi:hypothetical protein
MKQVEITMKSRSPQRIVRAMPGVLALTIAMIAALGGARAYAQGGSGSMLVRNSATGFTIRSDDGGRTWQRMDPEELAVARSSGGAIQAIAWPNPTAGTTAIRYSLQRPASVLITVNDMAGEEVARYEVGMSDRGDGAVLFNAATVPPGAYYYRIESDGQTSSGGILLVTR